MVVENDHRFFFLSYHATEESEPLDPAVNVLFPFE